MTVEAAYDYASLVLEREQRGSDIEGALRRIKQRYGISPNQLMHLRSRRAKSCDLGLFAKLKAAYLDLCERQIAQLQHEIAVEKATGDDTFSDLEAEAQSLAEKVRAKKAGLRLARSRAAGGDE